MLGLANQRQLLSHEHFTVDGTLLEAWASHKSFRPKAEPTLPPSDDDGPGYAGRNPSLNFRGQRGTRALGFTPHVSPNPHRYRGATSAVDGRTTRHPSYAVSQRKRKLVEQGFGWQKCVGLLRKLRHRGRETVGWIFAFTSAAYNLVRIRSLLTAAPA